MKNHAGVWEYEVKKMSNKTCQRLIYIVRCLLSVKIINFQSSFWPIFTFHIGGGNRINFDFAFMNFVSVSMDKLFIKKFNCIDALLEIESLMESTKLHQTEAQHEGFTIHVI